MTFLPTVIFDLGGVYFTDGTDRAIKIISEKYSVDRQEITDIFYGEVGLTYRENKITMEEFWETAKKRWNIENESTEKLAQIWHKGYVPIKGVREIVTQLKKEGCELFYLSGSTKERAIYLENKYGFLENFKDGVFTFSVGVRKPNLIPYQCILGKTLKNPTNCIYVDNSHNYLVPAIELGMRTILYKDSDNLRIDLKKNGFMFL